MTNPFNNPPAVASGVAVAASPTGVQAMQNSDPYAIDVPSGISGLKMDAPGIINTLLLVEPIEYIASMTTAASTEPTDAFRVNILPLEGVLAGELQKDAMVFQVALKRELKNTYQSPNKWLLAFLTRGVAKPGKSAPYLFDPPNEAQMATYQAWAAKQRAATAV